MTHIHGEGKLVRIFIGESDRLHGRPLHEEIVKAARTMGLGGATVLRGVAGYGAASVLHTARLLRMSSDLPIVVEVVEMPERIDAFLDRVEEMLDQADCGGLITVERAEVIRYTPSGSERS